MSAEPTPLRDVVFTAEMEARRARQKARGQMAQDIDFDRMAAEVSACNGECTAPGSTRGGVLLGDGSISRGMVAVDEEGYPLRGLYVEALGGEHQLTRPCFDCNRDRWEAWQDGSMSRKARAKVENAEDRQLADQGRRRTREERFR